MWGSDVTGEYSQQRKWVVSLENAKNRNVTLNLKKGIGIGVDL